VPEPTFTDLLPADFEISALRRDARDGLAAPPRTLPPRWFYDKAGSELFEQITELPEYYPTRTERDILTRHAAQIIATADPDVLVELGSGSSQKTTLLLDALLARHASSEGGATATDGAGGGARYVAVDVSEDALRGAAAALAVRYPALAIDLLRADFTDHLDRLPAGERRTVAFLGGTIGNFEPASRARFLAGLRSVLSPGEHLLLGADLVKPESVLVPAYDDAAGVTAAFNRNVLQVLNARLGADAVPEDFDHVARWNAEQEWIEMRLRARRRLVLTVAALDLVVPLERGEDVLTEISAKFRPGPLAAELRAAGFAQAGWWTDDREWFSLSLWRAV